MGVCVWCWCMSDKEEVCVWERERAGWGSANANNTVDYPTSGLLYYIRESSELTSKSAVALKWYCMARKTKESNNFLSCVASW